MNERQNRRSLDWIALGLDERIAEARRVVESYLGGNSDTTKLQECQRLLSGIHADMERVGLPIACLLCEQLGLLVGLIIESKYASQEDAFQALLGGLVQLPNYLARVRSSQREQFSDVLAVVNDIRAAGNQPLILDDDKFNFTQTLDKREYFANDSQLADLLGKCQQALTSLNAQPDNYRPFIAELKQAVDNLTAAFSTTENENLAVVVDGNLIDAIQMLVSATAYSDGRISLSSKYVLVNSLQLLQQGLNNSSQGLAQPSSAVLVRELIFCIAICDSNLAALEAYKQKYGLLTALAVEHASQVLRLGTPDADTMDVVFEGLSRDLALLKRALEQNVESADGASFEEMAAMASTIRYTMQLAQYDSWAAQMSNVVTQLSAMQGLGQGSASVDINAIPAIAETLHKVEFALQQTHIGGSLSESAISALHEAKRTVAVIRENLTARKNSEKHFYEDNDFLDFEPLGELSLQLREVAGAMQMMSVEVLVDALACVDIYLQQQLIVGKNEDAVELAINALGAIESYIEAAKYSQQDRVEQRLMDAINELGVSSMAATIGSNRSSDTRIDDSAALATIGVVDNVNSDGSGNVVPIVTMALPQDENSAAVAQQPLEGEFDEEIVEIFLEEAAEVFDALRADLSIWAKQPQNDDRMTDIRRGFHTLKGSGRMAGAEQVGEVAWSIESLINRMSDGSIPIDQQRVLLITEAADYIPHVVSDFSRRLMSHAAPMQSLISRAELLSNDAGATVEIGVSLTLLAAAEVAEQASMGDTVDVSTVETSAIEMTDAGADELELVAEQLIPAELDIEPPVLEQYLADETIIETIDTEELADSLDVEDLAADSVAESADLDALNQEMETEFIEPEAAVDAVDFDTVDFDTTVSDTTPIDTDVIDELPAMIEDAGAVDESVEELTQVDENVSVNDDNENHEEEIFSDSAEDDHYLHAIFISELEVQLSVINGYLESHSSDKSSYPSEAVERAFHTIVGGARIAGNQIIADMFAPAEILVSLVRKRCTINAEEHELFNNIYQWTNTQINSGVLGHASIADEQIANGFIDALNNAVANDLDADSNEQGLLVENDLIFNANAFLQEWRTAGQPPVEYESMLSVLQQLQQAAGDGQRELIEQLCGALVRLYGCFAGTGLHYQAYFVLLQAHSELEDMLDRVAAGQYVESSTALALLNDAIANEEAQQAQAQRNGAAPVDNSAAANAEGIDQEIVSIFLDESEDLIEDVEAGVQHWLNDRSDLSFLESLLRPLHTIKGGARMAGLESIGNISHEFETLLLAASNGDTKTDSRFFKKASQFVADLIAAVSDVRGKLASNEELGEQPSTSETAKDEDKRKSEVVRVSSGLLEQLVNLAGETSISRALVEEQVSEFSQSIDEIDSTIERLKEQLRRLEIEMEAQIEFRKEQVESEGQEEFDPLEMDRYSQVQQLSKSLIESASDLNDLKSTLTEKTRDMETLLLQQSRINTSLQEGLMRTRTVPLSRYIIPRLRRIVRQVSGELDKPVTFDVNNAGGELDRSMIERMVAPLEHVLRNAIDHGIEEGSERIDKGKPEQGAIRLNIRREGGDVVLELSDDGRGIDVDAVREKALARGLMSESDTLSDSEVMRFIFAAGFSTAKQLTQLSGRGVGMDVVQSEIADLGGSVDMVSRAGSGTTFTFRLPFTVSMNRALLVVAGGETLAVPLDSIEGIVRVSPFELEEYYGENAADFFYAGQQYDFNYLGNLINSSTYQANPDMLAALPVLLVRGGDKFVALQVDRLLGSREIVVKGLGAQFANLDGIAGATVLGDGSVVMIADLVALVRSEQNMQDANNVISMSKSRDRLLAMVVDDSVTVRKVTTRLLERRGMDVVTAKDGLDAMHQLDDVKPDFILLDIEMPRMDGFEVVARIRNDAKLAGIPIIMITSRTGDKHRERALGLGANSFLGKPYQEAVLFEAISEVLPSAILEERFGR